MKVAVSITKVFEMENTSKQAIIAELRRRMENLDEDDEDYINWYDLEPEQEIWSYTIIK